MKILYNPTKETKTCAVFQTGEPRTPEHQTLYLKKDKLAEAGIDPKKPITVTITQKEEE